MQEVGVKKTGLEMTFDAPAMPGVFIQYTQILFAIPLSNNR
jgi:hypothetical protein